jgi:hypothetical protein
VRIISPPNIGLFDRIANPGGPERESGTNLVVEIKYIIFQLLMRALQLAKQEQDEQHNQNQSTYANPGMAHAVAVTPEPAAESAQEINDHQNDQDHSKRHGTLPSLVAGEKRRRAVQQSTFPAMCPDSR